LRVRYECAIERERERGRERERDGMYLVSVVCSVGFKGWEVGLANRMRMILTKQDLINFDR